MKIKDLIEQLAQIENQDALVVLSKDGEGNDYSPLDEVDYDKCWKYMPNSTWSGDVVMTTLNDEWREKGFTDEDVSSDSKNIAEDVVVLWPVY